MTIRLVIADDHPVFRHGLRTALSGTAEIEVVGEATDGTQAVAVAIEHSADVVLMDLHMPAMSGLDAIHELTHKAPNVAILVLSMFDNDESVFTAIRAGARGYLVKGADEEQIVRAIQVVASGDVVFGSAAGSRALAYFTAAPATGRAARPFPELTDREFEVLRLIADGATNADIARRLHLSDKTVRNYVTGIVNKLQAEDRAQAAVRAIRAGLTARPPT
jgi:DNA-binding NarL/FixJ family response regulator